MNAMANPPGLVALDPNRPAWEQVYTVSPLVVIGTRDEEGYNLAPKHMAFPLSWENYFGFVCTPRHRTYQNAQRHGAFTVSYPRPEQLVLASLAAMSRRESRGEKPVLDAIPTTPAARVDGVWMTDSLMMLECELERIVDGFGVNSLIAGRVVAGFVDPDALRVSDRDDQELVYRHPLLAYLYPGRYAVVQETFAFPFPLHFEK